MSGAWARRWQRAVTQRIYFMSMSKHVVKEAYDFQVMGSRGISYNLHFHRNLSIVCSCPDCERGNFCKHMIFIMHRTLKQSKADVWDQYSSGACHRISLQTLEACKSAFSILQAMPLAAVEFSEEKVEPVDRKPMDDECCPICCESFADTPKDPTVWCRHSCGKSIHVDCWSKWVALKEDNVKCVMCRVEWTD